MLSRPKFLNDFQVSHHLFKDDVRGEVWRVGDQLMGLLLIGWW